MNTSNLLSLSKDDFLRMKLVKALITKMESIPFAKITVSSLCKDAGVSRATFYRLFENINEVACWDIIHDMESAARQHPLDDDWRKTAAEQIKAALELLLEEKFFFQRFYKEVAHTDYTAAYLRIQRYVQRELLRLVQASGGGLEGPGCEFEIVFWACGANNAVATWSATGMKEPPAYIAENVVNCIPVRLAERLDKFMEQRDATQSSN